MKVPVPTVYLGSNQDIHPFPGVYACVNPPPRLTSFYLFFLRKCIRECVWFGILPSYVI